MRYYAWYSPEINVIILQSIMEDCYTVFEWAHSDLCRHLNLESGRKEVDDYFWMPLGEL